MSRTIILYHCRPTERIEAQLNQIKTVCSVEQTAAKQVREENEIIMYLAHDIRNSLNGNRLFEPAHEAPDTPEQQYSIKLR